MSLSIACRMAWGYSVVYGLLVGPDSRGGLTLNFYNRQAEAKGIKLLCMVLVLPSTGMMVCTAISDLLIALLIVSILYRSINDHLNKWFPKMVYFMNEMSLSTMKRNDVLFDQGNHTDVYSKHIVLKFSLKGEVLASCFIFTTVTFVVQVVISLFWGLIFQESKLNTVDIYLFALGIFDYILCFVYSVATIKSHVETMMNELSAFRAKEYVNKHDTYTFWAVETGWIPPKGRNEEQNIIEEVKEIQPVPAAKLTHDESVEVISKLLNRLSEKHKEYKSKGNNTGMK